MKVTHVVGARPNFPKTAPIMAEMARFPERFQQRLVHTGQHYDHNMSRVFFEELEMPEPDVFLSVGSGTHAEQTARVMLALEPILLADRPDWLVVVGDVNSTLACALVCAKLGIPVAHVEAGLRSGDRRMPEEINRIVVDQLAELLLTPSPDGDANLLREGISAERIRFVGNVMIDTLTRMLPRALERDTLSRLGLEPKEYLLVTLHRPSNVDDPGTLREIMTALVDLARETPVVFPIHPRTRGRITQSFGELPPGVRLIDPAGYLDFVALQQSAKLVLTDSGGVQEETTYLGVPCLTARPNTERPVTVTEGTNQLVESRTGAILDAARRALGQPRQVSDPPRRPALWDGAAASRIVAALWDARRSG